MNGNETQPGSGRGCGSAAAAAIVCLIGAVLLMAVFLRPLRDVMAARNWVNTRCVITGQDPLRYSFEVGGRRVEASHRSVLDGSPLEMLQTPVRRPNGTRTTCWVPPGDPEHAVLDRGWPAALWLALIPAAMVVLGALGVLRGVVGAAGGDTGIAPMPRIGRRTASASPAPVLRAGTPVKLKRQSPWVAAIVLGIFAAFWNGAILMFVADIGRAWQHGMPGCSGWFETLFAVPFVGVGVGTACGSLYFALKALNPKCTATLSAGQLPLGGRVELNWIFEGNVQRITRLSLRIEGVESATYRRGTSTTTDKATFYKADLFETTRPQEIRAGQVVLSLPDDLVPTFEASRNKIIWSVCIDGEIHRWPDVNDRFDITVVPGTQVGGAA